MRHEPGDRGRSDDPLRLVAGGASADAASASHARSVMSPARYEGNRRIDDGGSLGF